jgi:hypothetical protein
MAPKSKAKAKPSLQTQFVLGAMEADVKWESEKWEKMHKSINLIFTKLDSWGKSQNQMAVQMEITVKSLTRSAQEHLVLAQQIAETSSLVARMAVGLSPDEGIHGPPPGGGRCTGPQPGGPYVATRSSGGHDRAEGEVSNHRSPLPKLSFPKFSGENPRIWIDKCIDYFKIFNIPECIWTTAASLHMENNAARWLQVYKM